MPNGDDLPIVLSQDEYDALLARGTREIEIAVQVALDKVEARIREQAEAQPVGSMAWRAHMADIAHVTEVRGRAATGG